MSYFANSISRIIQTHIKVEQLRMAFLYRLHEEVKQGALVVSIFGVGQLWQVGNVKAQGLLVPRAGVHDVSHQKNQLENLSELLRPANLQIINNKTFKR